MAEQHGAARREDERDLDLLVLGEINPDIIVSAPDPVPRFGQVERLVDAIAMTMGSSAVIVACGAARLGLRTAFVGVVGDDAFGHFMLDAMAARGVDVAACAIDPERPTGASVILAGPADRAILTAIGTIDRLDVDLVPVDLLGRARHVHVASYFLQRTSQPKLPAFFRRARLLGLTTSLDANWDPAETWDSGIGAVYPTLDVLFPNAAEAVRLAGVDDPVAAAKELARRGSGGLIVAVKCGARGGFAVRGDELHLRPAPPVRAIDTTGAGDSFDAGFLAGFLGGDPLDHALALAVACGSLSTERLGGTDGQPTLARARAVADALGAVPGE